MKLTLLAALATLAAAPMAHAGASGLKISARIAGPDGGWDLASFDPAGRRVWIARGDKIMVIDADSGKARAFVAGKRLHAVVPVPNTGRVVASDSGDDTAKVLDGRDGRLLAAVPASKDADSAIWEPFTRTVAVIGGDSGVVTLIDPVAMRAVAQIATGGALEFGVADGKGRLFVNGEAASEIVVIDLRTRSVAARWPMPGCRRPTGLALVAGERLVSACASGVAEIIDARTGRQIAAPAIGAGPDAVLYDPARALALIPCGASGNLAVIALSGEAANTVIDTVPTQAGARTGTLDPRTGRVYLPVAEYLPAPPGQRRPTKPGTFQVLVLDR
jgi:DNA-binding beta-propeller fold protein YncE